MCVCVLHLSGRATVVSRQVVARLVCAVHCLNSFGAREGNIMTRDVNSNQNRVNPRGCMAEIATTTLTWTYVGGGKDGVLQKD